ncbi:MAG: Rieske 2Fe-2S domain-containing protein [Gemmatimonadota bacterium]|nr:Rieske 2Fe-2S domain-containing protein [Gemmatimonadota bacterium]
MDQPGANYLTRRSKRPEPQYSDDLRLANYPPPYPDGWYRLLRSKSLRRGQVRYLECPGRALVVWRSEDADEVFAMPAFCPHLGANLAGGRVCKDRIECPFHGWQFTGDGRAASIPYGDIVPTRIATESFPVEEVHGQIFMYHRGGGARQQAGEEVPYPVPRIPARQSNTRRAWTLTLPVGATACRSSSRPCSTSAAVAWNAAG